MSSKPGNLGEIGGIAAAKGAVQVRRPKGIARRNLIMDAAEEVFSERGYYGTSMRDVSQRSGAALGVIGHHFSSKGILFDEVVSRKRDKLYDLVECSLERAVSSGGNDQDVIEAFIKPFLRVCVDYKSDIRNYIKLTSHFMSTRAAPEVGPALAKLTPITHLFRDCLRTKAPQVSESNLKVAAYLIDAALIFMVQDAGFLDDVSEGEFSTDAINELIGSASKFFCGGLRALST